MKKLFVSALAILGLVACAKDDVVSVQDSRNPIGFDTYVENVTRVGYEQTSDLTEFDVWAFMNQTCILNGVRVYDGPNYHYDNTQYWIIDQDYFFAALAPRGVVDVTNATNTGLGVVSFTNDGITDLIYATSTVEDASSNQGAVALEFKHLLSKVKFSFQNGFADSNYTFTVSGITMTAPESASINLSADNGEYTWGSHAGDITLSFGDTATAVVGGNAVSPADDRLTIPAGDTQVYNVTFDVNLYVGGNHVYTYRKTASISGITLEIGKAYNFAAVINPDSLQLDEIIFDATVDGWEDGTDFQLIDTAEELKTAFDNQDVNHIILNGNIDLNDLLGAGLLSTRADKTESLLVEKGRTLTLDLNGCTISQSKEQTGVYAMIHNKGTLIIEDNSGAKDGKIVYGDRGNGGEYASNTILNSGELTIHAGTVENNSSTNVASNGYPHPIDNNGVLTINGGTFTNSANYSSMRIWCTTDDNTIVTINGGTFNGSIDFQTPSAAANKGTLTIKGGEFNADTYTNSAVRLLAFGNDVDEMNCYISGGTFNGKVHIRNFTGNNEFNSQVFYITGGTFTEDPSEFVSDDYAVNENNGVYTIALKPVIAKIGNTEYRTLQKAVNEATNGDTIVLLDNVEQNDGVLITDKNITIDLNDKTFTVTEGANINNRNIKVNGESVVTIKNGTMVAAGEYSKGSYGTLRTEGTAKVTLEDVKLYNSRGNGLNVKALGKTEVTINNTEIYSNYGGGVEAAGGSIVLNNVKIEQKGMYTAPYNSMAISVNGGGTVTVNSGTYSTECITAEEANNQGTSHGPWCAGVLNSGGTLIINGGTFSNDNFGENSLATAARGLLLADTAAKIEIYGGVFNAVKAIIDIQNNLGDASKQPSALVSGGDFSADPRISAQYASHLISIADGFVVAENDDRFIVKEFKAVAKVGNVEYGNIDEAIAAWTHSTTLTLMSDVTLNNVITLMSTEHHILDLGTYTMTAASGKDAIEILPKGVGTAVRQCLTINADATTPGGITASGKSCIYYYNSEKINDRMTITINGGVFNGSYAINQLTGPKNVLGFVSSPLRGQGAAYCVINGGTFNAQVLLNAGMLKVTGGVFHKNLSCYGDSTAYRLISGGRFKSMTMTADAEGKFTVGTAKSVYDVGLYVDEEGYLVVGGPVITADRAGEFSKKESYSKWSSYLQYSSAAEHGLYYK